MLTKTQHLFDDATRVTAGASAEDLAAEDITRVLAVADAKIFYKSYGDQNGELWSPNGKLLATTTQIAYFKA